MRKRKSYLYLILAACILGQACSAPNKLVDQGRYDTAITKSKRKLVGKKNKSPKHVKALEEAFRKANERDLARVHALENSANAEDWDEIFRIGKRIENRQAQVRPILPLVDKNGYEAEFRMVNTESILYKAKDNAVLAWYELAQEYLAHAEEGDFMAAREALHALENIEKYRSNYRDVRQLIRVAQDLGTVRVLVRLENDARDYISPALEREIMDLNLNSLRTDWVEFVEDPGAAKIQFEAILRISRITVSPDIVEEKESRYTDEIEDGWQYVYDSKGNVMKDTLGNDLKVPKFVKVNATLLETFQEKHAIIDGGIELRELRSDRVVAREPLHVEHVFRHKAQRFFGDERALPKKDRRVITPVPFPRDEDMILFAIEELKPRFLQRIEHSKWL